MLESFTIETFSGRAGQPFELRLDDGSALAAVLVEVTDLGGRSGNPPASSDRRAPFSLVFRGPPAPILPQRIYCFEHPELGAFDLFVVPIGRDDHGTRYEAIFT